MRIEALETIKSDGFVITAGDLITVPDEAARKWIALGWAKDPAGVIATGERKVIDARILVQDTLFEGVATIPGVEE